MIERRSFLGAVGALLATPVIGQMTPATPKTARGMTSCVVHVDEFAYQPVLDKSGQVLMHTENGMEWRDLPADPHKQTYLYAEPTSCKEGDVVDLLNPDYFYEYRHGQWTQVQYKSK